MSPRAMLTLLAAASAVAIAVVPARADDGVSAPAPRHAAPLAAGTPGKGAKDEPAPQERPAPPAPNGCPFRDGKLDLIV